jgi:hypothetical protein
MPMLAKELLKGGLFIVEIEMVRLEEEGGELIVRNCCPKLDDNEQE